MKKSRPRCPHTSVVCVPSEDDPDLMVMVCTLCSEIVDVFTSEDAYEQIPWEFGRSDD